jgi:hypothetical protein
MSDSEIDTVADLILDEFTDVVGTGHVVVNAQSGWTDIGTFADTRRDQVVGTHPANTTIHTDNYVFRQNLTAVSPSPSARPHRIKYDSSVFKGIQEQSDSEIVSTIIGRAKTKLASFSIGTYKLQPSAPTPGTWLNVATVTNKTVTGNNQTILWRRTDEPTSTIVRPLKANTSTAIREMSDTEIKELTDYFRSEIVTSGVGKYQLSASTPSGGTWIQAGSGFSDTRHQRVNQNYVGNYVQSFTGSFTGSYTGYYSGSYAGSYSGTYTGYFTGEYLGYYNSSYTRYFGGSVAGFYAGSRPHSYSGTYSQGFTGSYTGYYSGTRPHSYTGTYNNYFTAQGYSGTYTGQYANTFAGSYSGTYTGYFSGDYTGYYAGSYNRYYGGSLNGSFSGTRPHTYTGAYSQGFTGSYTGYYAGTRPHSYTGTYTASFTGTYVGATILSSKDTINTLKLWLRTA